MTAVADPEVAARIDALLPQTQCTRCGFNGCMPYATAIAVGGAAINQCPPGGSATIAALSQLLGVPALPLNPAHGREAPAQVAWIDESRCIGCARCLAPCPVDAIVGAAKFLHTVITAQCTGCELCIAPCPVDCISLRPAPAAQRNDPALNRDRYRAHRERAERREARRRQQIDARKASVPRPS